MAERYAVAWLPEAQSDLSFFGVRWTGWCAETAQRRRGRLCERTVSRTWPPKSAEAPLAGFAAMLKAPFRLRSGSRGLWALDRDLSIIAEELEAVETPGLAVSVIGDVVALSPIDHDCRLEIVRDHVRTRLAPHGVPGRPSAERFHLPLTAPLPEGRRDGVARSIARDYEESHLFGPVRIADLALLWAPPGCAQMRVLERYPLTGGALPGQPGCMPCYGPDILTDLGTDTPRIDLSLRRPITPSGQRKSGAQRNVA